MQHDDKPNGQARTLPAPCPICGTPLHFGLLEITEDDGTVVRLLAFDCPADDYHGTMRESEVKEMFAREAVKRMRLLESAARR